MIYCQLAFALSEKAIYWIKEGVGILASAFVLVSFLFSNERKTRLINIVGAAIFVVYGIILPAYATSVMNGALIIVHVVKLTKEHLEKKKKSSEVLSDDGAADNGDKPVLTDGSQKEESDVKPNE